MLTLKCTKVEASTLWNRITRDMAVDVVARKMKHAEERQVKWTTYYNLDLWFDGWEKCLDELGFFEVAAAAGSE